jgi:large subunit ribosomal protein L28
VVLRTLAGIVVERAEPDRGLVPAGHLPPKTLEPQTEQNAFTAPSSGP